MHEKSMKPLMTVAVIMAFAGMTGLAQAAVENSQTAPDFELKDPNGMTIKRSDFQNKYVVLEWTNPQCPFVMKHYTATSNMQDLQKKYTAKGVIWLSVCSSAPGKQGHHTAAQWKELIRTRKIAATAVLLDEDGKIGKLYGAKTTPHVFVIAPDSNIIYQGAIDSIKSTQAEDVSNATNYVAETLDAHMAGKEIPHPMTQPYGCSVKY